MFGILLLTVSFGSPNTPHADRIVCPGPSSVAASRLSDERFAKLAPFWADNLRLKSTPTKHSDGVSFPVASAPWYQSRAGGKADGENAFYDAHHGVMFSCARYDTAMGFTAWMVSPEGVPGSVARQIVTGPCKTTSGLGFGASPEAVRGLYGPAPLQIVANGLTGLQYEKQDELAGNLHYAVVTTFVFRNDMLVGFHRIAGI